MGEQGALGIGEMGNDEVGNGHVDPNQILQGPKFFSVPGPPNLYFNH